MCVCVCVKNRKITHYELVPMGVVTLSNSDTNNKLHNNWIYSNVISRSSWSQILKTHTQVRILFNQLGINPLEYKRLWTSHIWHTYHEDITLSRKSYIQKWALTLIEKNDLEIQIPKNKLLIKWRFIKVL